MIVLLVLKFMTMTMTMVVSMVSVIVRVLRGLIGHHVGKYWIRYHLIDEFSITIRPRRQLLVPSDNFHDRTV